MFSKKLLIILLLSALATSSALSRTEKQQASQRSQLRLRSRTTGYFSDKVKSVKDRMSNFFGKAHGKVKEKAGEFAEGAKALFKTLSDAKKKMLTQIKESIRQMSDKTVKEVRAQFSGSDEEVKTAVEAMSNEITKRVTDFALEQGFAEGMRGGGFSFGQSRKSPTKRGGFLNHFKRKAERFANEAAEMMNERRH